MLNYFELMEIEASLQEDLNNMFCHGDDRCAVVVFAEGLPDRPNIFDRICARVYQRDGGEFICGACISVDAAMSHAAAARSFYQLRSLRGAVYEGLAEMLHDSMVQWERSIR